MVDDKKLLAQYTTFNIANISALKHHLQDSLQNADFSKEGLQTALLFDKQNGDTNWDETLNELKITISINKEGLFDFDYFVGGHDHLPKTSLKSAPIILKTKTASSIEVTFEGGQKLTLILEN